MLFLGGVVFCYLVITPVAFRFLLEVARSRGWALTWDFSHYLSLLLSLHIGFGASFEVPLVICFLIRSGLVRRRTFANNRKYVFLAAVVVGSVLTPTGDPVTQLVMASVVYVLYELGMLLALLPDLLKTGSKEEDE